jgi:hypothetical protein
MKIEDLVSDNQNFKRLVRVYDRLAGTDSQT